MKAARFRKLIFEIFKAFTVFNLRFMKLIFHSKI